MQKLLANLSQAAIARRLVLPLLKIAAFDFSLRHPWVDGAQIKLNSFKHKGYWFFGRGREERTMDLFAALIKPGDHVVEVGGHIGFISTYFASLVGRSGSVVVFEPGSNNLPYIRYNTANSAHSPIKLIEKAVGEFTGSVEFTEENLTGQNNSIVKDFDGLNHNAGVAFNQLKTEVRSVPITTLDVDMADQRVDFVKIDLEGYELGVLQGMRKTLERCRPVVMVEIQADESKIFEYFLESNYILFDEKIEKIENYKSLRQNIFAVHVEKHAHLIEGIFGKADWVN